MTSLLVASVDFGYGSSGKLSSIIGLLPEYQRVLGNSTHSRHIMSADEFQAHYQDLATADDVREVARRHDLSGALVVLNPDFAELTIDAGLDTVYVDSLPYLWTDHDLVPTRAAAYCAQMYPFMPQLAWPTLRRISNLRWVDGIVPDVAVAPGTDAEYDALVNLGGVGTHLLRADSAPYPVIVIDAALEALGRCGKRRVRVTGNTANAKLSAVLRKHENLDVVMGPLGHPEFQQLMASVPLVLTSPGLTTLIESGALGRPTVVLPPQNVAQFFNADAVRLSAEPADPLVEWPEEVIDRCELEAARSGGEDAALRFIYAAISRYEEDADLVSTLAKDIEDTIERTGQTSATGAYVHLIGNAGAAQVADVVRELFPVPHAPGGGSGQ